MVLAFHSNLTAHSFNTNNTTNCTTNQSTTPSSSEIQAALTLNSLSQSAAASMSQYINQQSNYIYSEFNSNTDTEADADADADDSDSETVAVNESITELESPSINESDRSQYSIEELSDSDENELSLGAVVPLSMPINSNNNTNTNIPTVTAVSSAINLPHPYTIILDLDETLLHSFFPEKVTPAQYAYVKRLALSESARVARGELDPELQEFFEVFVGEDVWVICQLRPYTRTFLKQLQLNYNIGLWSAGGRLYVDNISNLLFPVVNNSFQPIFKWCWQDCYLESNINTIHLVYTKPLHLLIEKLTNIYSFQNGIESLILLDNRRENGFHYPNHVIHCPDFLEAPWLNNQHYSTNANNNSMIQYPRSNYRRDNYLQSTAVIEIQNCIQRLQKLYSNPINHPSIEPETDSDSNSMSDSVSSIETELDGELYNKSTATATATTIDLTAGIAIRLISE